MSKRKRYLNTRQTAERLHVCVRTIQRWCNEGKLPGAHHVRKKWLIPETVVECTERGEVSVPLEVETISRPGEPGQAVARDLLREIKKVVIRLEQLTRVPGPETPLLPDSRQAETEIEEAALKGDTKALTSAMITGWRTPWWSATGSVQLTRHLAWEQEAVLKHILTLPTSQKLEVILTDWERKANIYLGLKQRAAPSSEIEVAYHEAWQVQNALHAELRDLMVAIGFR